MVVFGVREDARTLLFCPVSNMAADVFTDVLLGRDDVQSYLDLL